VNPISPADRTVSVVVPTFRRPSILAVTLRALLAADYPHHLLEILVVDDGGDGSAADTVKGLQDMASELSYSSQATLGAAAARNLGARKARGQVLLFIDDDIVVRAGSIRRFVQVLEGFAPCAVNARWEFEPSLLASLNATPFGRYRIEVERWVKTGLGTRRLTGDYLETEGVTACNLAIRRNDFWRIGGFDETFPHAGAEDQEFSLRAREAGLRLILDDAHEVWHNDHRLSLTEFCERQRRGALSAVYLAVKRPGTHAVRALIQENLPVDRSDPPLILLKKLVKGALSLPWAASAIMWCAVTLGRRNGLSPVLRRLYKTLLALAIFRGVHDAAAALDPTQRQALRVRT
jgi:GT2 family glycosyltransferase